MLDVDAKHLRIVKVARNREGDATWSSDEDERNYIDDDSELKGVDSGKDVSFYPTSQMKRLQDGSLIRWKKPEKRNRKREIEKKIEESSRK